MVRVVGIDHLVSEVSDYERSKVFYSRLFAFLGFEIAEEYDNAIGWAYRCQKLAGLCPPSGTVLQPSVPLRVRSLSLKPAWR